jgi:ABC-type glycerol-3-phosphate transport system substrate-binding protein
MITRRTILKTAAAAAATSTLSFPAIGQGTKKISFLTWNIIDQKELIEGWIKRFQSTRPGVEVEWLDKKGPSSAVLPDATDAGTPPDVINTQGALGLEYAAQGALMDLTPLFAKEAAVKSRYDANYLGNWIFEGKNYMVPFYITKTLLFYNKPMFAKAGLSVRRRTSTTS